MLIRSLRDSCEFILVDFFDKRCKFLFDVIVVMETESILDVAIFVVIMVTFGFVTKASDKSTALLRSRAGTLQYFPLSLVVCTPYMSITDAYRR